MSRAIYRLIHNWLNLVAVGMIWISLLVVTVVDGRAADPDLTISATVASSYSPNQSAQIPVTVTRTGGNLVNGTYAFARLYWSTNASWESGDSILWSANEAIPDFPNSTLNSTGSKTVNATITIPNVSSGTYYIIAYVDPTGFHTETNENNNIVVYTVTVATLPDLTVSATVASSYTPNQSVQIPVTVSRSGGILTSGTFVDARIYWSSNNTWDSGDTQLWSANQTTPDFPNSTLNSSGSKMVNATITIPNVTGTYYLIVYVDPPYTGYPNGYHAETNENNNIMVYTVTVATLPDLTISAAVASSYTPNQSVQIPVTVSRSGGILTSGTFVDARIYWSSNNTWDSGDTQLWGANQTTPDFPNSTLNSSGSKMVNATITIPNVTGTYYLIVYVDPPYTGYPNGYHAETNENNNIMVYTVTVASLPDLTVSATVASSYAPNQTVQIPVTVSRSGGSLTSGTFVDARIYWSSNNTWDSGDTQLWSANQTTPDFPNSTLNSSGSKLVNATITIPNVTGTYYLIVYVDPPYTGYSNGYHAETNENNNIMVYTVTVATLPDLTISAMVASRYSPNQNAQIPVTVTRTGGNLVNGTYAFARLYWSTNASWESGDTILWSANEATPDYPNSILNSTGSKTVNATITIPNVSNGTYYIIAYADPTAFHPETNENNNIIVYTVTVSASSSPQSMVPLFRSYNTDTKDHFYTITPSEKSGPSYKTGYKFEKIEAYIYNQSVSGTVPLFRYYYPTSTMHYFTTNPAPPPSGYDDQKTAIVGYVYPNPTADMVPMYHLEHETNTDHFYTISEFERNNAIKQYLFKDWGIAMYVARNALKAPLAGRPVGQQNGTDLASGNFKPYYNHADFVNPPGIGIPFVFARTYNAMNSGETGPLGPGWNHSYNIRIVDNGTNVMVKWGDGKDDFYTVSGSTYTPFCLDDNLNPSHFCGNYDILTKPDSNYTLIKKDQTKYIFEPDPTDVNNTSARLKKIVDRNGNTLTLSYNDNDDDDGGGGHGNINMISDGNSVVGSSSRYYQFTYIDLSQIPNIGAIEISDSNRYRLFEVHEQNAPLSRSFRFSYNEKGNLVKYWDAENNLTQYEYNEDNLLKRIILPRGNDWIADYDTQGRVKSQTIGQETTKFSYSQPDATTIQTTVQTSVDEQVKKTTSSEHSNWKLAASNDGSGYQAAEVLEYDANRNPIQVKDRNGNIWKYTYNLKGNILTFTTPAPLNETTYYTYDASGLYLKQVEDPSHNITKYEYDANGNLWKIINVVDGIDRVAEITRYSNGMVWKVTDPRLNTTIYEYDAYGYPNKITDPLGKVEAFTFDLGGRLKTMNDPDGVTTTYTYDNLNRVRTVKDHQQKTTTYDYDENGNLKDIDDPRPTVNEKVFSYNNRDQMETAREQGLVVATKGYDELGRLSSIKNAKNRIWRTTYDAADNIKRTETPLGYADVFSLYDGNRNLKAYTDRTGRNITHDYDNSNRLKNTNPPAVPYSFTYYPNGLLNTAKAGTNQPSSFEYSNLKKIKTYTDPFNNLVSYTYDEAGNLKTITFNGKTVTYTYDVRNMLDSVKDWYNHTTYYEYTAAGRIKKITYPNGAYIEYVYDPNNPARLKSFNNKKSDGSCIACNTTDAFDELDAPTQVTATGGIDSAGSATDVIYDYDENNRITAAGFTYNNQGEILTKKCIDGKTATFGWDSGDVPGLLKTISKDTTTWQYSYDGLENRTSRTKNGITTRYVLDVAGDMSNVIAETDGIGNIQAYYVHGLGLVSKILPDGTTRYFHYDMTGNTVALTDSNGNVTDQYAYNLDLFGFKITSQGATENPFKFVGRYGVMDEGENIFFMRARYYDAELGRFLNEDPIGFEGEDLNLYAYVRGNPVTGIDPNGLKLIYGDEFKPLLEELKKFEKTRILLDELDKLPNKIYLKSQVSGGNIHSINETDVEIVIDAKHKYFKEEGSDIPTFIKLAHELGHAYAFFKSNKEVVNEFRSESFTMIEYENYLRIKLGLPLRGYHDTNNKELISGRQCIEVKRIIARHSLQNRSQ